MRKKMLSKKKSLNIVVYFLVLLCMVFGCLRVNIFGIVDKIIDKKFPETKYTNEDFRNFSTTYSPLWLNDAMLNDADEVETLSSGAWIFIGYKELNMPTPLYLKIVAEDEARFNIYSVEGYQLKHVNIEDGEAIVNLGFLQKDDAGIRIDIEADKGETVRIESIALNDKEISRDFVCRFFRNIAIFFVCILGSVVLKVVFSEKNLVLKLKQEWNKKRIYYDIAFSVVFLSSMFLGIWEVTVMLLLIERMLKEQHETVRVKKYFVNTCMGIYIVLLLAKIQSGNIWILNNASDKIIVAVIILAIWGMQASSMGAVIAVAISYFEFYYFDIVFLENTLEGLLKQNVNQSIPELNCLITLLVYICLQTLIGKRLGNLIYFTVTVLYYVGNLIKMKYQGTIFRASDLKLWKELLGIMGKYVPRAVLILTAICLIGLLIAIIMCQKKIIQHFRPHFSFQSIYVIIGMITLCYLLFSGHFSQMGVLAAGEEQSVSDCVSMSGFQVYTLFEFTGNNRIKQPEK